MAGRWQRGKGKKQNRERVNGERESGGSSKATCCLQIVF